MSLEVKDLEPISQGITEIKSEQKKNADTIGEVKQLATDAKTEAAAIKTEVETVKTDTTELKTQVAKVISDGEKNQTVIDNFQKHLQGNPIGSKKDENKTFNQLLEEGIYRNAEAIQGHPKGSLKTLSIDLMPDVKEERGKREVKVVGDMSIGANFSGATALYQDVRQPIIQSPYNRVWLSDVLPTGTTNGTQVVYPKENGGEGAAAIWNDFTADKAQMDYDLDTATSALKWIAGIVIVAREMLDDIPWLTSYLQNKMLISLKTAENDFILNGDATSPAVSGLLDVATAYNGAYTATVDMVIDALYGQIVEDTNSFYTGTTLILRPREAVRIGLNKATGSGEYDLPNGSAAFATGRLALAGVDTVTTTAIGDGDFVALDKTATIFIRRMAPELRMFEDSILAKKNKVMFRIEERATIVIFNNSAIVSGSTGS